MDRVSYSAEVTYRIKKLTLPKDEMLSLGLNSDAYWLCRDWTIGGICRTDKLAVFPFDSDAESFIRVFETLMSKQ